MARCRADMRWACRAALGDDLSLLEATLAHDLDRDLGGEPPDLVCAFVVPGPSDQLASALEARYPGAVVIGCAAGGVVGGHRELEGRPSLSITAARLPDVTLHSQAFGAELGRGLEARHLRASLAPGDTEPALVLALLDPKGGDPTPLLAALDAAFPEAVVVGGLASGAVNQPCLLVDGRVSAAGGILVALHGALRADSVVAQGCKPIGQPCLVTRVEGQLVQELNQQRPIEVMRALHESLSPDDRALFERALFLGVEMRDQVEYGPGDFLIRNVIGVEPKTGALAVAAEIEQFKAVQFHLRDAETSAEDLRRLLDRAAETTPSPCGALMFSCLGRGEGLYGEASHDTRAIRERFENVPVGGFFCNGEIGAVGDRTYLHGYTSAIALISEP